jgi:anti-sigma factor RsiW
MDCEQARERIQDALDDRLPAGEIRELEEHLESCAACAAERDSLRRTVELLRGLPREPAPASLAATVREGVRSEGSSPRGRWFELPVAAVGLAAAAAVLLLAVLVFHPGPAGPVPSETQTADAEQPSSEAAEETWALPGKVAREASGSKKEGEALERLGEGAQLGSPPETRLEEKDGFASKGGAGRLLVLHVEDPAALAGALRLQLFSRRTPAMAEAPAPAAPGRGAGPRGEPRLASPGGGAKGAGGDERGPAGGRSKGPRDRELEEDATPSRDAIGKRRDVPDEKADEAVELELRAEEIPRLLALLRDAREARGDGVAKETAEALDRLRVFRSEELETLRAQLLLLEADGMDSRARIRLSLRPLPDPASRASGEAGR